MEPDRATVHLNIPAALKAAWVRESRAAGMRLTDWIVARVERAKEKIVKETTMPNPKHAQHTPGPWRYCRTNGSPTHGEHVIAGATPGYLAEVRDCGSGDVGANARLIAAAPELLAVLLELQESAGYWSEYDVPVGIVDRISAALAKATGSAV